LSRSGGRALRNLNARPCIDTHMPRYGVTTVVMRPLDREPDLTVVAHSYRNGGRPGERHQTLHVLLGIEHPVETIGVRLALERGGFKVCAEADSAHDAIAAAERENPDVCLIDVNLVGGGIRAAEEIARRVPGTAIVVFSESESSLDFFDAIRAGARGYLLVDADPERLPHALRAVVNGEAALPRHLVPLLIDEYRKLGGYRSILSRNGAELTNREVEVLGLMAESLTTQEIAERLSVEPVTVRTHVSSILKKLHVSSRSDALKLLRH
jgi:DNA-binding NarL/FixJ family response regulator